MAINGATPGKRRGGRKKGIPNKITFKLLDDMNLHGLNPLQNLADLLNTGDLSDKDRAMINLHLMDFIYPKRKPVDEDGSSAEEMNVHVYDAEFGS